MSPLTENTEVIIELTDMEKLQVRLYMLYCADCGKDKLSEVETLHEMICENCGKNIFRVIRNQHMEKLLGAPGRGDIL
jgi:DNA-directed RNA polymerase subunit RPC12/RpoP